MRRLILSLIFLICLSGLASAGWGSTLDPSDINALNRYTIGSTDPIHTTTFDCTDNYFSIIGGDYSSGIINGSVSSDQYYRYVFNESIKPAQNWDVGKPRIFFYTDSNYVLPLDSNNNNVVPAPITNGYTIECGYRNYDVNGWFKLYINGAEQTPVGSNCPNFTQNTTLDFYVKDGRAIVKANGIEFYNVSSVGGITRSDVSQFGNTMYLYKIQSAPSYFVVPTITWSSPETVSTTQYDPTPSFSFSSTQAVDYTITDGEIVVTGNGVNYEYTPGHTAYGIYPITFSLSSDSLETTAKTYTWTYAAAPVNEAPVFSEFTPSDDISIYQYQPLTFSTDVIGEVTEYPLPTDVIWKVDSSTVQTNTSAESARYVFSNGTVGTYAVVSSATNEYGSASKTVNVTVLPNSMTISNVSYYPSGLNDGTIIQFTASNFTDGIHTHGWSPVGFNHTTAGNTYYWTYANGSVISQKTASSTGESLDFDLNVVPEGIYKIMIMSEPSPDYSYGMQYLDDHMVVSFTDGSTGGIGTWTWDFGDSETSTEQNPTHIYASQGVYSVKLTAGNSIGHTDITKSVNASRALIPYTGFTTNVTSGYNPLTIQFLDNSTNTTSRSWDFGDGVTSTALNPVHTYSIPGNYSVVLTATNTAGSNTSSQVITSLESTNFSMTPSTGVYPLTVKFTDRSHNASSWSWDFENDGVKDSVARSPIHTFGKAGIYNVNFTTINEKGTTSKIISITVNPSTIGTINKLYWWIKGYFTFLVGGPLCL